MIKVLASEVVDRIAAGEVVERPSSVVKELVENSLDAGARSVAVEYSGGGVRRIEVADDGLGMESEEALLALERHATSKIETERDLLGVPTYGFRGEALPSIASVSRFSMLTRRKGTASGTRVRVEGGHRIEHGPAGAPEGTRIRVEDLFWNTPARLKFLKTERTESVRIGEALQALALAHPRVRFDLHRDGVELISLVPSSDLAERAAQCFPRIELHPLEYGSGPISIEACLCGPETARAGTSGLVILVNGRSVADRSIAGAIAAAYEGLLDRGRYPQGVVSIRIDGSMLDVNVHPQKREVRFSDPRLVSSAAYAAVSGWAKGAPWLAGSQRVMGPVPDHELAGESAAPFRSGAAGPARSDSSCMKDVPAALPAQGPGEGHAGAADRPAASPNAPVPEQQPLAALAEGSGAFSRMRFVGQVLGCYLVCEDQGRVVVVDQHAAAERVAFERLRAQWRAGTVIVHPLLVAIRLDLDARRLDLVEQNEGLLQALGMGVDISGPGSVTIREVPLVLAGADPTRLLDDALQELEDERGRIDSVAEHLMARMACHGSIRAGARVEPEQARALLESLDLIDWAGHCPHGRPVKFEIGRCELERRFGR